MPSKSMSSPDNNDFDKFLTNGTTVKGMTYGSQEYDEDPKEITGSLTTLPSPFDGPPMCWIGNRQVDPSTIREVNND